MNHAPLLAAIIGIALGAGASRLPLAAAAPASAGEAAGLPAGLLSGLDADQRAAVLEAMHATPCSCGAASYAACQAAGSACPRSRRAFLQGAELARLGTSGARIAAALQRAPTAATAPLPARARPRAEGAAHAGHVHADDDRHGF